MVICHCISVVLFGPHLSLMLLSQCLEARQNPGTLTCHRSDLLVAALDRPSFLGTAILQTKLCRGCQDGTQLTGPTNQRFVGFDTGVSWHALVLSLLLFILLFLFYLPVPNFLSLTSPRYERREERGERVLLWMWEWDERMLL
jgi:uncharacterized membrane-anchored protein YitT (DUF2179 family)